MSGHVLGKSEEVGGAEILGTELIVPRQAGLWWVKGSRGTGSYSNPGRAWGGIGDVPKS